jgi:hypothetical protein
MVGSAWRSLAALLSAGKWSFQEQANSEGKPRYDYTWQTEHTHWPLSPFEITQFLLRDWT